MTANECKRIVRTFLSDRGITPERVTAKTIDFTDLARATMVFVTVRMDTTPAVWTELQTVARDNGFRIT